jgi:lycopene beta-cyclase
MRPADIAGQTGEPFNSNAYDFIIAGAGCAGLSLAMHMIHSGKFKDKKILLADRVQKNMNDRTWCFWERSPGIFESIVCREWNSLWFHGEDYSRLMEFSPYRYKMIRGIDFYEYCLRIISQQKNFTIQYGDVESFGNEDSKAWMQLNGERFTANYIFNSIPAARTAQQKNEYWLLQHFKGWMIETLSPSFDPAQATLMDFRIGQDKGTSFVYVMPLTETKALVEYTLFTRELLAPGEYTDVLENYLVNFLHLENYSITEEEFGVIPMTNHRFPTHEGRIIFIGSAGGQTKPSSGYTFHFIQQHSKEIVECFISTGNPLPSPRPGHRRFRFYDNTFLHLLYHNRIPGKKIFSDLFRKNEITSLLRFLDNESTPAEELKIMGSLDKWEFLKAVRF